MEPLRLTAPRPKPRKSRARVDAVASFSVPEALRFADQILAGPCAGHLPRVAGKGALVARFALRLDLVKPQNALRRPQAWAMASLKAKVFRFMNLQHPEIRREPLPGRPFIRCIRFSSVEPDAFNDGFKMALDCLCPMRPPKKPGGRKKLGLGLIRDDAPRFVEIAAWWEKAPPGRGMALLEVFTGER